MRYIAVALIAVAIAIWITSISETDASAHIGHEDISTTKGCYVEGYWASTSRMCGDTAGGSEVLDDVNKCPLDAYDDLESLVFGIRMRHTA